MTHLCDFGCGKQAVHFFKTSNKWCCSFSANKCEAKRERDRLKKKGINPWAGKEHPKGMKGKEAHNKGRTYEELYGIEKAADLKRHISKTTKSRDKRSEWDNLSQDRKDVIITNMRQNRTGGYHKGSGRGKKGRFNGIWCDSSWELAFLVFCIDHDIQIERNKIRYSYVFAGKQYTYLPDFIIHGNQLVEIKGILTDKEQAKIDQCPEQIKLITKCAIKPFLDYCINKYGRNFTQLYQKEQ